MDKAQTTAEDKFCKQGWIIAGQLPEGRILKGVTELPYGNRFNTQDWVFLDSLLRGIQEKGDLVEGVNLVVEFTPTTKSTNYEYSDRSHIAIAYDDNRFRFDIAIRNAVQESGERVSRLVQLVNTWTGITNDWEANLKETIKAEFPAVKEKIESYNSAIRTAMREATTGITDNTNKVMELLKANQILIPRFEDYQEAIRKQYRSHFDSIRKQTIKKIESNYPREMEIPLQLETEKGLLGIKVRYRTQHSFLDSMEEDHILGEYDAVFIVDGQLAKPEFNLSLEAIHSAGFQGIREIYWKIPKKRGSLDPVGILGNSPSPYEDDPKLEACFHRGVISAIDSFRKSVIHSDETFYREIRKHFCIVYEYQGHPLLD